VIAFGFVLVGLALVLLVVGLAGSGTAEIF
jgi:hypothetical protein